MITQGTCVSVRAESELNVAGGNPVIVAVMRETDETLCKQACPSRVAES